MTRILYLVVDDLDPDPAELHRIEAGVGSFARGPVTVTARPIQLGLGHYYESALGLALAAPGVLHQVDAHQHDTDAIMLGCFGDPGLSAAREISGVPVIGAGEASLLLAQQLAPRFGILHIQESNIGPCKSQVAALGLTDRCVGMGAVDLAFSHVLDDVEDTVQRLAREGDKLVLAGARVIILGCLSLGLGPFADKLSRRLGVPVLNPIRAAMAAAETTCSTATPVRNGVPEPEHFRGYLDALVRASDGAGLRGWRASTPSTTVPPSAAPPSRQPFALHT